MNPAIKEVVSVVPFSPIKYTWVHISDYVLSHAPEDYKTYTERNNIPWYADGLVKDLPLPIHPVAMVAQFNRDENTPSNIQSYGLTITIDKVTEDSLMISMWSDELCATVLVEKDFSGEILLKIQPNYDKYLKSKNISREEASTNITEMFESMLRVALLLGCKDTVLAKPSVYKCSGDIVKNAKRKRKGKRPFWEWQTIDIKPMKALPSAPQGGTHASPKPHERMGHWRMYKSGKRIFVKPHIINKHKIPDEGFVFHDYTKGKSSERQAAV